MFTIDLREYYAKAKAIEGAARQMPFLLAYSLTKSMQDAREAEYATMRSVVDRPRPFTLNSLQVVPATKATLRAEMRPKEFGKLPAWRYLGPHIAGGSRSLKSFERALQRAGIMKGGEYAMPAAGATLDAFGNMSGGVVTRILSAIGANPDAHQNTKPKGTGKRRRKKKVVANYFVSRGKGLAPGVYQRLEGRRVVPVIIFTRAPQYAKRFPYYEVAGRTIPVAFQRNIAIAWDRYVLNPVQKSR